MAGVVTVVEWQQLLQAVFIALLFSFLLAKLISTAMSFKQQNLTLTRSTSGSKPSASHISENDEEEEEAADGSEKGSEDWEGVESTELDEKFSAATAFVAAAASGGKTRVSDDVHLRLYALYKIATEGPCTAPQPSPLKMTARAKWQSWRKLGAMLPEDAMQNYIDIVMEIYPSWDTSSSKTISNPPEGSIGPVLSTLVYEEEPGMLEIHDIHAFAREGDESNLLKCIESGISVDYKDSEGRTPLHWAVDRGHLNVVEMLVRRNADVNSKDKEGQTPLHYAVMCEREGIGELLVKFYGADTSVKDVDGLTPLDMSASATTATTATMATTATTATTTATTATTATTTFATTSAPK